MHVFSFEQKILLIQVSSNMVTSTDFNTQY